MMVEPTRGIAGRETFEKMIAGTGGDHVVFSRIASGETIASIAKSFGRDRDTVYRWLNIEERRRAWEDAKRASADALVEAGLEIIDDPTAGETTARVQHAKSRAEYRRWLASCRSEEYRDHNSPVVQLNIQQLHLDALRKLGSMDLFPREQRTIAEAVVDVEIEVEGED
jgi:transposase-like protein